MKVVLLQVDDWTVLYIDGKKIEENHSLDPGFVLEAIAKRGAIEFESHYAEPEDVDLGIFYPEDLSEVDPDLRGDISL